MELADLEPAGSGRRRTDCGSGAIGIPAGRPESEDLHGGLGAERGKPGGHRLG